MRDDRLKEHVPKYLDQHDARNRHHHGEDVVVENQRSAGIKFLVDISQHRTTQTEGITAPCPLHHGRSERIRKLKPKRFHNKTAFKLVIGTVILPGLTYLINVGKSTKTHDPNTVNLFAGLWTALPCQSLSRRPWPLSSWETELRSRRHDSRRKRCSLAQVHTGPIWHPMRCCLACPWYLRRWKFKQNQLCIAHIIFLCRCVYAHEQTWCAYSYDRKYEINNDSHGRWFAVRSLKSVNFNAPHKYWREQAEQANLHSMRDPHKNVQTQYLRQAKIVCLFW